MANDELKTYLWETCERFIDDNAIDFPESIYQNDAVSMNALEFIELVADIVGYRRPRFSER